MSLAHRHISIKISGTPVKKAGFLPIVNINDAFFEIRDTYPSILTREACLYSVAVLDDMTVYKLVFYGMRHNDGSAARLVIGFSVPVGYSLPSETDPASVLDMLLQAFVDNFTVALPDGTFEYRIGRLNTSVFEAISKSLELVVSDAHGIVMKDSDPRGAIEVSDDSIAIAMDEIGRTGAEGFSEVIVGQSLNMPLAGIAVALPNVAPPDVPANIDQNAECDRAGMDNGNVYINGEAAEGDSAAPDTAGVLTGSHSDAQPDNDGLYQTETPVAASAADNSVTDYHSDAQSGVERHRIWPALLSGLVIGATIALAIVWLMFKDRPAADMSVAAPVDTVVISADTVASAHTETVFVEKKVIVEVAPKKAVHRNTHTSPSQAPVSSPDSKETIQPQETPQAPRLKYDPEAERSL